MLDRGLYTASTSPAKVPGEMKKKATLSPKLRKLLTAKNAEYGGQPIRSSTYTTDGFNQRKWESTCFEETNTQLV